jgi:hypothetical protein
MRNLILILFVSIFSIQTNANDEKVLTIFAVDCGEKAYLLDYKEFYTMYPNENLSIDEGLVEDAFEKIIDKFKNFEEGRSFIFKQWFKRLKNKVKFVKNVNLGSYIDNTGFITWDGCEIRQMAKGININEEGKTLTIDEEIWNKLDSVHKAGAFLNYFLNIEYLLENENILTLNTRYFNGLLSSDKFVTLSKNDFPYIYEFVLGYRYISFGGIFLEVKSYPDGLGEREYWIRFNDDGEVIFGEYTNNEYYFARDLKIYIDFINAPSLKGRYGYSGQYKFDEEGYYIIDNFYLEKQNQCLGNLSLKGKRSLKLKIHKNKNKIVEALGEFYYLGSYYKKIVFDGEKFVVDLNSKFPDDFTSYVNLEVETCE